jgi:signal transduction histidine kinase
VRYLRIRGLAAGLRPTGLRARLLAAFLAVALLASMLTAGIAYLLERRAVLQRSQDAIMDDVRSTVSQTVAAQVLPGNLIDDEIPPIVSALSKADRDVIVVGPSGKWQHSYNLPASVRLPQSFGSRPSGGPLVFQRMTVHGTPYLVVSMGVLAQGAGGMPADTGLRVFVIASLRTEAGDIDQLAWSVGWAGAAAVGVALILGLLAAGSLLRPVRRLSKAALTLGAGRLDTRVVVKGRDELADLARMFNVAAHTLERNDANLRALEASARRFAADVSHELRTPLTAITAVTDVLEEEASSLTGPAATAATLITAETRRLRNLVEHLVEISRFDAGAASLVLDDRDVSDLVRSCLRLRLWTDQVELHLTPGLRARIDPRRVDVIIANLVGNALRHGVAPVTVRLGPTGNGVTLTVADEGPGIPASLRPHIFDRFVKGDAARAKSEGSGLGLAIARANAELHGGRLTLGESETGTVFELWLPTGEGR